jgi:hypothetical protein
VIVVVVRFTLGKSNAAEQQEMYVTRHHAASQNLQLSENDPE